jgi:hypothetical protein
MASTALEPEQGALEALDDGFALVGPNGFA